MEEQYNGTMQQKQHKWKGEPFCEFGEDANHEMHHLKA